jgi:hypothetical protein
MFESGRIFTNFYFQDFVYSSVMLTAIILVCSLAITPDLRECGRDNATNVMQVPEEFALPSQCMIRGQAFLAETSIGQDLAANERVKVVCTPTHKLTAGRRII